MKKIELLSPAGDLERLKVTLLYGADAVYIGGKEFSLRANATNFSLDEIKEACLFAHKLDKKVFLTVNMVMHETDLEKVYGYIDKVINCGIDAFIVSDYNLAHYIKEKHQKEVHISTQDSVTNKVTAKLLKDLGVKRIVLARELSKEEIKEIINYSKIDIEVFIHGAMCTCMSGRCALSNYTTGRDANRGGCAQVCRFVFDSDGNKFTMATKDLNMAKYIKDLIDIGVASLKVEGRMRSLYYLATVIGTYRKIIDDCYNNSLTDEKMQSYQRILNNVANRESTTQYFMKEADQNDQYFVGRQEVSNQEYLGLITGYDKDNKCLVLKERNYFEMGDKIEIFTPKGDSYQIVVEELFDEDMNELDVARHPEQVLKIRFPKEVEPYSMIRLIEKRK